VTNPNTDSVRLERVPDKAPKAFASAVVARAKIGLLEHPIEQCAGYSTLHDDERAWVLDHAPRRAREFVAGRTALRAALRASGWEGQEALLRSEQGRPSLPSGFTGSISHKDGQAFAFARRSDDGRTLGIDTEVIGPRQRLAIARKVLTAKELVHWERERSWPALLQTFSLKEAIYKALHPHVPRYIGFEEAEVGLDGHITMTLKAGEGPFRLVGWWWWEGPVGPSRRLVSVCEAGPA